VHAASQPRLGRALPGGAGNLDLDSTLMRMLVRRGGENLIYQRLCLALGLTTILLVLGTFTHYGVTRDEAVQARYGELVINYYASGFTDLSALNYSNLYLYGGLFDVLAQVLVRVSPLPSWDTRHLFNALWGLWGLWGCIKLARSLGGPAAGFWAGLLLAATPMYYGHMFNNPKDIPFAAAYVWVLYYLASVVPHLPRAPRGLVLKLGLAVGVCLGIRVGGVLVLSYLGLLAGVWLAGHWWAGQEPRATGNPRQMFLGLILPVGLMAWAIMLLFWPWAQQQPLARPYEALGAFSRFSFAGSTVLGGQVINSVKDVMPRDYLPTYFAVQLPEIMLGLLGLGLGMGLWSLRRFRELFGARWLMTALVAWAAVFPLAYGVAARTPVYNAVRHFLFILPPLACLGGLALARALVWLQARWRPAMVALLLLSSGGVAWSAVTMVGLHPYQYLYFNYLVGGPPGAQGRYDLDYWGHCGREALLELEGKLREEAGEDFPRTQYRLVMKKIGPYPPDYLPPNFQIVDKPKSADFILANSDIIPTYVTKGREIVRIERLGAHLFSVMDWRTAGGEQKLNP
jgi:hypothetical protein